MPSEAAEAANPLWWPCTPLIGPQKPESNEREITHHASPIRRLLLLRLASHQVFICSSAENTELPFLTGYARRTPAVCKRKHDTPHLSPHPLPPLHSEQTWCFVFLVCVRVCVCTDTHAKRSLVHPPPPPPPPHMLRFYIYIYNFIFYH